MSTKAIVGAVDSPLIAGARGSTGEPPPLVGSAAARISGLGDRIYSALLLIAALSVLAIIVGLFVELTSGSWDSLRKFGPAFFIRDDWDPGSLIFGALPFIEGTLYSTFWALVLAVPVSLMAAIFLAEISPPWLRTPLSFLIELLAAVPSVVYGAWGIFVLQPWLVKYVETPIANNAHLSKIPDIRRYSQRLRHVRRVAHLGDHGHAVYHRRFARYLACYPTLGPRGLLCAWLYQVGGN